MYEKCNILIHLYMCIFIWSIIYEPGCSNVDGRVLFLGNNKEGESWVGKFVLERADWDGISVPTVVTFSWTEDMAELGSIIFLDKSYFLLSWSLFSDDPNVIAFARGLKAWRGVNEGDGDIFERSCNDVAGQSSDGICGCHGFSEPRIIKNGISIYYDVCLINKHQRRLLKVNLQLTIWYRIRII